MKTARIINLIGGIIAATFAIFSAFFTKYIFSLMSTFGVDAADPAIVMETMTGGISLAIMFLTFLTFVMFIYGIVVIVFNARAQMTAKALGIIGGATMVASFIYFFIPVANIIGGLITSLLLFLGYFLPKDKNMQSPMGTYTGNDEQGPTFE